MTKALLFKKKYRYFIFSIVFIFIVLSFPLTTQITSQESEEVLIKQVTDLSTEKKMFCSYNTIDSIKRSLILANTPPYADFSMVPDVCKTFETIQFTDASYDSDGEIQIWLWEFGDGNISTEQHPQHTYSRYGYYNITLTVWDNEIAGDHITKMATINNRPPIARNDTIYTSTNMPVTIPIFENDEDIDGEMNYSSLSILSYPINGTLKIDLNEKIIRYAPFYQFSGIDTIVYTVKDDAGAYSSNATVYIYVDRNIPPVAHFYYSPTAPRTVDTITFFDNSTDDGAVISWLWDFGDGMGISTVQNPTYTYQDDGNYTVILSVEDNSGSTSEFSQEILINNTPPIARNDTCYCYSNNEIFIPVLENDEDIDGYLVNNSIIIIKSTNNGTISAIENGTLHYIPSTDFYGIDNVSYRVLDDNFEWSNSANVKIFINRFDSLTANFTYTPLLPKANDTIQFTDTSLYDGKLVSWLWDFGDGNSSSQQNITHSYTIAGEYIVSLTIWDGMNATDTSTKTLSIEPLQLVPSISIIQPLEFTILSGMVNITGTTSFSKSNDSVEIRIDSGEWTTVSGRLNWFYLWDTTQYSNTEHTVTVRLINQTDQIAFQQITVHIENEEDTNEKPILVIEQPTSNVVVSGEILIRGTVSDDKDAIESIEIRIDDGEWDSIDSAVSWEYLWNTTQYDGGTHIIYARCYDGITYSNLDSVRVYVQNQIQDDVPIDSSEEQNEVITESNDMMLYYYGIIGLLCFVGFAAILLVVRFF